VLESKGCSNAITKWSLKIELFKSRGVFVEGGSEHRKDIDIDEEKENRTIELN